MYFGLGFWLLTIGCATQKQHQRSQATTGQTTKKKVVGKVVTVWVLDHNRAKFKQIQQAYLKNKLLAQRQNKSQEQICFAARKKAKEYQEYPRVLVAERCYSYCRFSVLASRTLRKKGLSKFLKNACREVQQHKFAKLVRRKSIIYRLRIRIRTVPGKHPPIHRHQKPKRKKIRKFDVRGKRTKVKMALYKPYP